MLSQEVGALEWKALSVEAEKVKSNEDFQKAWKILKKFQPKVQSPTKEAEMYKDKKALFEQIATPLGLQYAEQGQTKVADVLYPDGIVAPQELFQHHLKPSWEELVTNKILDVEIKKPWETKSGSTPWDVLPSNGNAGGTPSAGLKEAILRATQFFKQSTTQQQTYTVVISDLRQFVFFSMDRTGQVNLSFPVPYGEEAIAMIWHICTRSLKANGFRSSVAKIIDRQFRVGCFSSSSAHSSGILESDLGERWFLDSLRLLGRGTHGLVFSCTQYGSARTGFADLDLLCLKLAPSSSIASEQLDLEAFHLRLLHGCTRVPKVIAQGNFILDGVSYRGLLTDVVGIALSQLSMSALLSILPNLWHEMLSIFHQIHSQHVVHADIKPDHFIVNRSGLWVVDFGSAFATRTRFLRNDILLTTPMFSSSRVLSSNAWPKEEDDIQSAAYSLVALLSASGMLPEDHQSEPIKLLASVRPQHRNLVRTVLADAQINLPVLESVVNLITEPATKKRRNQAGLSPSTPKRRNPQVIN